MIALTAMEYPLVAAALIVALGVITKFLHSVYTMVRSLDERLDYVSHEMELNSGKTMRDAIARIEARQIEIEAHLNRQDKAS